jgi:DNA ligase (NAD+)
VRPEGEADWRCANRRACPSQGIEWLAHFASRGAMNIDHLGYKTGLMLMEKGWVEDPGDLYTLTAEKLGELPGFKAKSIDNLLGAIEASKDRPLWRLLVGLSIRHVGSRVSQLVTEAFPSIDALQAATLEQLEAVREIGPEIAQSIHAWLADSDNQRLVDKLRRAGVRMQDEARPEAASGPLTGKSIVLTGGLEALSREEATQAAQAAGARIASSVSKKTDFVVAGKDPGSKYDKAVQLGVELIDEAEFLRRIGRG